jgi:hypothetical protein
MTRGRRFLCLGLGLGSALAFASRGFSERAGDDIAFLRHASGFWQVWLMAGDGSEARPLTRSPVDKVHAAWRPASRELLYHTNRGETFVLDVESGRERRLLEDVATTDAAWSPDGSKLSYSTAPQDLARGKTSLWLSDVDGRNRRKLAGGDQGDALAPSWLSDGKTLLYRRCLMLSHMEVDHEFWLADVAGEGSAPKKLEGDDERLKFDQALSSTGVLAYSSPKSGRYEIWAMPVGGSPTRLTDLGSYAGNPSWSPDGRSIAFDGLDGMAVQIYRIGSDGRGLQRLTSAAEPSRKPVWNPGARPSGEGARKAAPAAELRPAASAAAPPRPGDLAVSWVSTDQASFWPEKGESVELRYQVSQPSTVTVRLLDPDDRVVRTIRQQVASPGAQKLSWDGRDDGGQVVPPDAYVYVISARSSSGDEVTYDLRGRTGGETVWPLETALDAQSLTTRYTLPQASRVRLIMSRQDTTLPIRTLLDWSPREAGRQEEGWDGWDAGRAIDARKTPQVVPILYAFSLPKNVVIVRGASGSATPRTGDPVPSPPWPADRKPHLHARHARSRCYDPRISLSLPEAAKADAGFAISKPTLLRLGIEEEQGGRDRPIPRVSVFIYVDGVLAERYLVGYAPFQWRLDPQRLGRGEHVVTGLMAWRDDHFGIAHVKVRVE